MQRFFATRWVLVGLVVAIGCDKKTAPTAPVDMPAPTAEPAARPAQEPTATAPSEPATATAPRPAEAAAAAGPRAANAMPGLTAEPVYAVTRDRDRVPRKGGLVEHIPETGSATQLWHNFRVAGLAYEADLGRGTAPADVQTGGCSPGAQPDCACFGVVAGHVGDEVDRAEATLVADTACGISPVRRAGGQQSMQFDWREGADTWFKVSNAAGRTTGRMRTTLRTGTSGGTTVSYIREIWELYGTAASGIEPFREASSAIGVYVVRQGEAEFRPAGHDSALAGGKTVIVVYPR